MINRHFAPPFGRIYFGTCSKHPKQFRVETCLFLGVGGYCLLDVLFCAERIRGNVMHKLVLGGGWIQGT